MLGVFPRAEGNCRREMLPHLYSYGRRMSEIKNAGRLKKFRRRLSKRCLLRNFYIPGFVAGNLNCKCGIIVVQ